MNTKTFGLVLTAAWIAAIVWIVVLITGDEPPRNEPGDEVGRSEDGRGADQRAETPDAPPGPSSSTDLSTDLSTAPDAPIVGGTGGSGGEPTTSTSDTQANDGAAHDTPARDDTAPAQGGAVPIEVHEPDEVERRILKRIFEPLEAASDRYAKHEDLDESSWFGEDQESNQAAIDKLLDEAIETLGLSAVDGTRRRLRDIRSELTAKEQQIARDREARLSAPMESELSVVERQIKTSREDYDGRIRDVEESIAQLERERADLETRFVDELRAVGLNVSRETARGLLSTVSGEDFVEMCVVFHNVRLVTVRLQQLTEDAGESLEVARRYYGSYVVLVRILDHIQKDFVRRVREEQVPRLDAFAEKARLNIDNARRNLASGGDPRIAEQNIRSNELTQEACRAYSRYLLEQAGAVEDQNEALQPRLRDAINTFDTVQLSSQVADAIRDARRNFAALLELDVPDLRGFENVELQQEFERLTDQLFQP